MASWGQTPFSEAQKECLFVELCRSQPPFEFNQKNVYSQNNWTRGGGGVRAKWQNFRTRIPLLWVRCQLKTFLFWSFVWKKNLFQMLLAPLCPRVTRSSARSCGARFSLQLWRAGFNAGSNELGSIPAIANSNWSSISFDENLFCFNLLSCPRETGSPGRLSGDWLLIFFLDGLGSIPALLNSFYLFPVVEKDFLFLLPFCPRETASPTRIFFGS